METIELQNLKVSCPECGSDKIVYTCDPECCFNHICEECLTTFELATVLTDKDVLKGDFKVPEREVIEPTTDCDACYGIEVYALTDSNELVCVECGNLLILEYVDVQAA